MPAKVVTDGDPEDEIKIQFNAPRWMKIRAAAAAKAEGMAYSEFLKMALRTAIETAEAKRPKRR